METTKVDRARVMLLVIAMTLAALALVLSALMSIGEAESGRALIEDVAADRGRFLASTLLAALFAAMLALSGIGFMLLARARAAVLMTVGGVLMLVGGIYLAAGIASYGMALHLISDPAFGIERAVRLDSIAGDSAVTYLPWVVGGPAAILGAVLVGIALLIARSVRLWVPILWLVGLVILVVTPGVSGFVGMLTVLPLAVALVAAALELPKAVQGGTRATVRVPAQAPRHADRAARAETET